MILSQEEFAYNNLVNMSTWRTPFEIVIEENPRGLVELRDINMKKREVKK